MKKIIILIITLSLLLASLSSCSGDDIVFNNTEVSISQNESLVENLFADKKGYRDKIAEIEARFSIDLSCCVYDERPEGRVEILFDMDKSPERPVSEDNFNRPSDAAHITFQLFDFDIVEDGRWPEFNFFISNEKEHAQKFLFDRDGMKPSTVEGKEVFLYSFDERSDKVYYYAELEFDGTYVSVCYHGLHTTEEGRYNEFMTILSRFIAANQQNNTARRTGEKGDEAK